MSAIRLSSTSLAVLFAALLPSTAYGRWVEVGTLTCKSKGTVGWAVTSKQSLGCRFKPWGKKPIEFYSATIIKYGLDIGVTGPTTMIWSVMVSRGSIDAGAMSGSYAGGSADASLGIGGGASVLVGGTRNSIALQPLSVQGQIGLNVAVGVTAMRLRGTFE